MPPPNILLFISDGHRADVLGCYGNTLAETTHLDAFAAEAVRFDHAYCLHSVCMPTRASIITGRYPHARGVWANGRSSPDLEARGLDPNSVNQIAIQTRDWKLIHYVGETCGELYDLANDPGGV